MNRQLIAFLSMFSLVLVLSIYYVMLPVGPVDNDQNVNIEDSTEVYFATLELEKTASYQGFIDNQNSIIASADASATEKAVALETIENKVNLQLKETKTVQAIKAEGFSAAYVESTNSSITVIVMKKEATATDAIIVIKTVKEQFGESAKPIVQFKG